MREFDPAGVELEALERLAGLSDRRVLELGCGDGRLTLQLAAVARSVLATDPAEEAVERARQALPAELAGRVTYRVGAAEELDLPPRSFDVAFFSWSLC